jgi:hypothetical protein
MAWSRLQGGRQAAGSQPKTGSFCATHWPPQNFSSDGQPPPEPPPELEDAVDVLDVVEVDEELVELEEVLPPELELEVPWPAIPLDDVLPPAPPWPAVNSEPPQATCAVTATMLSKPSRSRQYPYFMTLPSFM